MNEHHVAYLQALSFIVYSINKPETSFGKHMAIASYFCARTHLKQNKDVVDMRSIKQKSFHEYISLFSFPFEVICKWYYNFKA